MIQTDIPDYKITYTTTEPAMPYIFEPHERTNNILYVLEKLNALLHGCDTRHESLYTTQIEKLGSVLVTMLSTVNVEK